MISADGLDAILESTGGHPTRPRSCATSPGRRRRRRSAATPGVVAALAKVLRSEHAHFSLLWERASSVQRLLLAELAREPGGRCRPTTAAATTCRAPSTVQRAVEALERDELVARDRGLVRIVEPFLAAWLRA